MSILTPYRIYKDLDFSFPRNSQTGDVGKKLDINAVKQSLQTLLMTNFGERLFQPDIGTPLNALLFEPLDPVTTQVIKTSITNLIQNHEPRVKLSQVNVVPQYADNSYAVTVYFTVIGIPLPVTFSTILTRIR